VRLVSSAFVLNLVAKLWYQTTREAETMFSRWTNSHHDQENDPHQAELKVNELKDAIGPQSGRSLQFCTNACFRRYLEARNWNVEKSKKCWKRHSNGDQPLNLRKFDGMKLQLKVRLEKYTEQIFMTEMGGVFLY